MAEKQKANSPFAARKTQPLFGKEVNEAMTDNEQVSVLIDNYTNLQRIKMAEDRDKEIDYQLKATKAKLETHGISTENLDIH